MVWGVIDRVWASVSPMPAADSRERTDGDPTTSQNFMVDGAGIGGATAGSR
jgi:hypothetical protein